MEQNPYSPPHPLLEAEDFYYEGANLVFTAAYHIKRGSCCGSQCRHCPYGEAPSGAPAEGEPDPSAG